MHSLAHDVYFTLTDSTDEARSRLVASAHAHLAGHAGIDFFAVGTRVAEHARDVNDDQYDVSLHVCFESKAAHDAYQVTPEHKAFIDENEANWTTVRVFDSFVQRS